MKLVHVLDVESPLEITEHLGAAQVAARSQFVAMQLNSKRDIYVDFVAQRTRVAADVDIRVGAAEIPGVEVSRIGRQRDDAARPVDHILDIHGRTQCPCIDAPVDQTELGGQGLIRSHEGAAGRVHIRRMTEES